MKELNIIYRDKNINLNGTKVYREAVRGIILDKNKIILIQSAKYGEYKFPGGGVEKNETYEEALQREILEEAGLLVKNIKPFGYILEYANNIDKKSDTYVQKSMYFTCEKNSEIGNQNLDKYEQVYGYEVKIVSLDEAITNNELINYNENIPWVLRETWMLNYLKKNL